MARMVNADAGSPGNIESGGALGSKERLELLAGVDRDDAGERPRLGRRRRDVIRAWATVLRTNAAWSMPGSWMSSM